MGGIYFNTDDVASPGASTISDNEFTQSVGSDAGSGDYGQAVLIWQKAADNVSIQGNDFSDLSGPGANINTTGAGSGGSCPESSTGLSISDNTSEVNGTNYDDNLVALFCTTDALITGNTFTVSDADDTNAVGPIYLGGGDISTTVSGNTLNGNGAPYSGGAIGVGTPYYPTNNATIESNTITGWGDSGTDGQGIVVYGFGYGEPTGFTIENNTITDSGYGIWIYYDGSGYPSGTIANNYVHDSITTDCQDDTSGSGTDGTNDTWSNNIGTTSAPSGLCGMATTGVTTAVDDASTSSAWAGSEVTGATADDTSSVTGAIDDVAATGTVSYTLFDTTDCTDAGTSAGSGLSLGSDSSTVGPLAAGSYGFEATYSGDSNYAGSTSSCEPFSVGKAAGGITTTVDDAATNSTWSGSEATGSSAYDTSSVTGEEGFIAPTGSVSYSYFSNGSCTSGSTPAGNDLALGSHSTTEGPLTQGSYGFEATYSGDSNYTGFTTTCEPFSVATAPTGVSTTVDDASTHSTWSGSEATGASAYDTSSVTGEVDDIAPTGTISYSYFTNGVCSGAGAAAGTNLALGSHSSTEGPLSTGTYGFEATYSGDSNYSGNTSSCESFSVGKGTSPTKTTPTDSTIVLTLNQSDTDVATVTGNAGGGSPTGSMTYYVCGPTSNPTPCTSMANEVGGTVSLSPGAHNTATATSASFTPNAVGYWCFASYYSGDSNYNTSSDATVDECVNVEGPLTMITTSLPSGTKGTAYSTTLVARGGTQPYRWTHGHLPRGLGLNRNTGVLSGTPRGSGTYNVTIHVRDRSHPRELVTVHFTLTIAL